MNESQSSPRWDNSITELVLPISILNVENAIVFIEEGHIKITRGENTTYKKFNCEKFRHFYFENLNNCLIFSNTKTLRIMLARCENCKITARENVIGPLDIFLCKNSGVYLEKKIGYISFELCDRIKFSQHEDLSTDCIVKLCVDIFINISNAKKKINVGKLIWGEQEGIIYSLDKDFTHSSGRVFDFELNSISHQINV